MSYGNCTSLAFILAYIVVNKTKFVRNNIVKMNKKKLSKSKIKEN